MKTHDIHYLSTNITKTSRGQTEQQESRNSTLLQRAGYIYQVAAGNYTLLPLGVRVLRRIETIVRGEMSSIGAQELLTSSLQPRQFLDASKRWDTIDVLYKLHARQGGEFCLAATGEEIVASATRNLIQSHRDLPLSLYQISEKFRDEARPRSGLLRGRVFWMKDLYSVHATQEDLDEYYEKVVAAYMRFFDRIDLGSRVKRTFASGGVFSQFSDEFQLIAESGEDTIYTTQDGTRWINKELAEDARVLQDLFGTSTPKLIEHRAIEVGNTFKLGTRFSDAFGVTFQDMAGARRTPLMCSYGIGMTRAMAAVAEVLSDDAGLRWPRSISPYDVHVVILGDGEHVGRLKQGVIDVATTTGQSALIDERGDVRAGEKFADADLIGIPLRVVIGSSSEKDGCVEVSYRGRDGSARITVERLAEILLST